MATIIVATDGSDAATRAADAGFTLAGQTGDHVAIVVVRDLIRGSLGLPFAYYDQHFLDADLDRAKEVLAAAAARAAELDIDAEPVLVEGEPVAEICRMARDRDARLIVIGAHGWGVMRAFIHGSIASGILRYAPCPVLCGAPGTREQLAAAEIAEGEGVASPTEQTS